MNTKYEFLAASALFLVIAALAVVLVVNVLETSRTVIPAEPGGGEAGLGLLDPDPVAARAAGLPAFPVHIDIFDEPWKPASTPTPVVLPTPTPTQRVFGDWDVILIIGDAVQIRDIHGGLHYLGEDDTFEGCTVEKVDWEENSIQVRNNADGRVKTLRKTGR